MATKKTSKKSPNKNLVIVESPAKAKTLKKFLGSNYKIEASMGHVRDLPKSSMGIDFEDDFNPKYITIRGKGDLLAKLRKEVKSSSKIYLATDPDREGEAISWHLMFALKLFDIDKEVYRITFNEITKQAVKSSIKEAREIDMNLVDAQQARRELDRIVGYSISPLLWSKVKKGLSAGRVQSVALKMICDREEDIENFINEEYWTVDFNLKQGKNKFLGKLKNTKKENYDLTTEDSTDEILKGLDKKNIYVENVKKGTRFKNTYPPFTTSTMQQEASKSINFATSKTMKIAQELYEGVTVKGHGAIGLVSYIRTDSVRISDTAYEECKNFITNTYGTEYLPAERNIYKSRGKAQDAHEAIRPTYVDLTPYEIKDSLSKDQYKLYKLIWDRFVASQMEKAKYATLTVDIKSGNIGIRSTGSILEYEGFLKVYKTNEEKTDKDIKMPDLAVGDKITLGSIDKQQHFTQPPGRYSEASLIKTLEEVGIGRPSTYAPTISTIVNRGYITKESKVLYSTELGSIVNEIMKKNFNDIIDVEFTSNLESQLDKIEEGKIEWKEPIRLFYPDFKTKLERAEEEISKIEIKDEETDVICENCGKNMVIKMSKHGKFLACPGFPDCRNTKPYYEDAGVDCPYCKDGRVIRKKSKKGRLYFGCTNNPECEFISWNKPSGDKCPECNSILVIKGTKNKRIACSSEDCGYTAEYKEENEENEE
ncbi:MAG: type I DNA topoisomerase [Lachnospirales bacterium]